MLNHINLCGRLTRDVELRYTQSQKPVASFTIAVDRDGKEAGTDFIDIVAWRGLADMVCKYFSKGRMMAVEGRLQIRDWTDQNGNKRRSAEVIAENVYFADSRKAVSDSDTAGEDFREVLEGAEGELPF